MTFSNASKFKLTLEQDSIPGSSHTGKFSNPSISSNVNKTVEVPPASTVNVEALVAAGMNVSITAGAITDGSGDGGGGNVGGGSVGGGNAGGGTGGGAKAGGGANGVNTEKMSGMVITNVVATVAPNMAMMPLMRQASISELSGLIKVFKHPMPMPVVVDGQTAGP